MVHRHCDYVLLLLSAARHARARARLSGHFVLLNSTNSAHRTHSLPSLYTSPSHLIFTTKHDKLSREPLRSAVCIKCDEISSGLFVAC